MFLFLHEIARWIRIKRGTPSDNDKLWLEAKAAAKALKNKEIATARAEEPLIREKAIAKLKARAAAGSSTEVYVDVVRHEDFFASNADLYYHTDFVANFRKMGYHVRVVRTLNTIQGFLISL